MVGRLFEKQVGDTLMATFQRVIWTPNFGGMFIASYPSLSPDAVQKSTDGINWTRVILSMTLQSNGFGDMATSTSQNKVVATAGTVPSVFVTTDGTNWTEHTAVTDQAASIFAENTID